MWSRDDGHALTGGFSVFGYDVTGSTGTLFLDGIVVGSIAMLGLSMLLPRPHLGTRHAVLDPRQPRPVSREPISPKTAS